MSNFDHSLEPGFHSQVNKAAKLFGSTGNEAAIGIFAFEYDGHGEIATGTVAATSVLKPVATIASGSSLQAHN